MQPLVWRAIIAQRRPERLAQFDQLDAGVLPNAIDDGLGREPLHNAHSTGIR
jgi:hypothetical protein